MLSTINDHELSVIIIIRVYFHIFTCLLHVGDPIPYEAFNYDLSSEY